MCGIAGIRSFNHQPVVDPARLHAMGGSMAHRGPDDSSVWVDGPTGLAHRRLAIIDLQHSQQPMHSADGRWTLVFNGEIFNYRELRRTLDYPFRTDGDTETILAGVAAHGLSFITRLVGQFALALVDRDSGSLFLVRDRLGVLPLYYRLDGRELVFGSEIKTVLAGLPQRPEPDLASLDLYLAAGSVPAPHTLFEGISKLPAAHYAEIDATGHLRLVRYWRVPEEDPAEHWTPDGVVDAVDEAVGAAVRSAMVADVPVGAYLSGGVDSSLISATARRLFPDQRLHTFAAGFEGTRDDELPWARRVSEHIGSTHHEVVVRAQDFAELWPMLTWHRDGPVSQPADIAVFRLAQAARERVAVILSGEGGDELFAGYPKHRTARLMALLSQAPSGGRAALSAAVESHLTERWAKPRIALRVLGEHTASGRNRAWFAPFTSAERRRLLGDLPRHVHPDGPAGAPGRAAGDPVRTMLVDDLASWLPDNLLERGDRMSMAASLELRPPLLDHRLVELAFRLPSAYKVRNGTTKWALKEVARRVLPDDVVDRRKVGFRVPLDAWFRTGLRESVRDRLTGPSSFVAEVLDRDAVRSLVERHESARYNEEMRIFTLMSLEVWHETFFRGTTPSADQTAYRRSAGNWCPAPTGEQDQDAREPGRRL